MQLKIFLKATDRDILSDVAVGFTGTREGLTDFTRGVAALEVADPFVSWQNELSS